VRFHFHHYFSLASVNTYARKSDYQIDLNKSDYQIDLNKGLHMYILNNVVGQKLKSRTKVISSQVSNSLIFYHSHKKQLRATVKSNWVWKVLLPTYTKP
jgi:hypothetical protein